MIAPDPALHTSDPTQLFLLATSDWDSATLVIEPPSASPQFTAPTEEQRRVATEVQPQIAAEARPGDQTPLASASATLSVEPAIKDENAPLEVTSPAPEVASAAAEAT
jgi:hypothetical protein